MNLSSDREPGEAVAGATHSEAIQKEFAFAVGISERKLSDIENNNGIIKRDVLDRLARRLNIEPRDTAYAVDGPRLVPAPDAQAPATNYTMPAGDRLQPRYDTEYASATMVADELYKRASGSHTYCLREVCSVGPKPV